MNLPQELVRHICAFSDSPTLASICLSNKAFYLDARAALYFDLTFSVAQYVDRFLLCGRDHLNLVKHLSLHIPSFPDHELEVWKRFLVAIRQDSDLVTLRITSPPTHSNTWPEIRDLAGDLLSIPSLKYIAVATSVVSTTTAIQCPALRELELRGAAAWNEGELSKYASGKPPKLQTLCIENSIISSRYSGGILDLSELSRLSTFHYCETLEMTCGTLTELSICIHPATGQGYTSELHKLTFPHLQTFIIIYNRDEDIDHTWATCDDLLSIMISVSGTNFREFRLYLHNIAPSAILKGNESSVPSFHPQIAVLRIYCWDSFAPHPTAEKRQAEIILRSQFGAGRDFQVVWSLSWIALTYFCELRERSSRL
ncbi:hypothetical protein DL96DRAFT_1609782 [Flagelloscypha sp. PMI_526]|nr:hypothetical protein DL96DRAFT_1609782 [Flagelloscypha sp. PMI_526]